MESAQASVIFHDVAMNFSQEEWARLGEWQKALYRTVMEEIHAVLIAIGYRIIDQETIFMIRREQAFYMADLHPFWRNDGLQDPRADYPVANPNLWLRLKKEEAVTTISQSCGGGEGGLVSLPSVPSHQDCARGGVNPSSPDPQHCIGTGILLKNESAAIRHSCRGRGIDTVKNSKKDYPVVNPHLWLRLKHEEEAVATTSQRCGGGEAGLVSLPTVPSHQDYARRGVNPSNPSPQDCFGPGGLVKNESAAIRQSCRGRGIDTVKNSKKDYPVVNPSLWLRFKQKEEPVTTTSQNCGGGEGGLVSHPSVPSHQDCARGGVNPSNRSPPDCIGPGGLLKNESVAIRQSCRERGVDTVKNSKKVNRHGRSDPVVVVKQEDEPRAICCGSEGGEHTLDPITDTGTILFEAMKTFKEENIPGIKEEPFPIGCLKLEKPDCTDHPTEDNGTILFEAMKTIKEEDIPGIKEEPFPIGCLKLEKPDCTDCPTEDNGTLLFEAMKTIKEEDIPGIKEEPFPIGCLKLEKPDCTDHPTEGGNPKRRCEEAEGPPPASAPPAYITLAPGHTEQRREEEAECLPPAPAPPAHTIGAPDHQEQMRSGEEEHPPPASAPTGGRHAKGNEIGKSLETFTEEKAMCTSGLESSVQENALERPRRSSRKQGEPSRLTEPFSTCEEGVSNQIPSTLHRNAEKRQSSCAHKKSGECFMCEKDFEELKRLRKAKEVHKCKECQKGFCLLKSLIGHQASHTGYKRFKCPECDFSAHLKKNLRAHQSRVHKEKPYPCTECEQSFRRHKGLLWHQKSHIHRTHIGFRILDSGHYDEDLTCPQLCVRRVLLVLDGEDPCDTQPANACSPATSPLPVQCPPSTLPPTHPMSPSLRPPCVSDAPFPPQPPHVSSVTHLPSPPHVQCPLPPAPPHMSDCHPPSGPPCV